MAPRQRRVSRCRRSNVSHRDSQRLRAFCGDKELTPIHAFIIEQRVSEKDTINEGLYAFDPGAFEPTCVSVKLLLYPDKEREKPDTVVIDAKVIQQIWQDFAPYRALK